MEPQLIEDFFIYDTEERKFYQIDEKTSIQIDDYGLEIEYKNSDYKIDISISANR